MERINSFLKALDNLGCDSAIISNRANVQYLSRFTGSSGYLIITKDKRLLVTDSRYTEQASGQAKNFEIINSADFDITECAKDFENTAFENSTCSYSRYLWLEKNFKNLVHLDGEITRIRSVKDEYEKDLIRNAARIADEGFAHIVEYMKEGMTEAQVARELEYFMTTHGASKISFDTIVATGARGSLPHAEPEDNVLKEGDLVVMDFGCVYKGYCSDMTRTVGIGSISDDKMDVYNTVLKAQLSSLEKIKPGAVCSDVHNTAQRIIDEKYKGFFGHSLGHGVGLEVHERPNLSSRCDIVLQPGHVVTVEPGIYLPGNCGVRIEDLVVVTEDGYENFTSSTKELILI